MSAALTWPLQSSERASTYYRHVTYTAMREFVNNLPTETIVYSSYPLELKNLSKRLLLTCHPVVSRLKQMRLMPPS